MNNKVVLKPCPFCGGEAAIIMCKNSKRNYAEYWGECANCNASHVQNARHNKREAVAIWNIKRPEAEANANLIAAAPEMYGLLQKMYDWDELQTCRIPDVEEVLKKARGEK